MLEALAASAPARASWVRPTRILPMTELSAEAALAETAAPRSAAMASSYFPITPELREAASSVMAVSICLAVSAAAVRDWADAARPCCARSLISSFSRSSAAIRFWVAAIRTFSSSASGCVTSA